MKKLCALMIFFVVSSLYSQCHAEKLKAVPMPKPYVWADWLTETEKIWLNKYWSSITVNGGKVFMDIGVRYENDEQSVVPDTLIRLFKRYQQASIIIIRWSQEGFAGTFSHDDAYSLKEQRLINLDVWFSDYTSLLNGPLKIQQMREVAAGRITLEQAWNNCKEVKLPVKK